MKKSLRRTLLSTLVVPFALGAQSASAAMITNWTYDVSSVFTNPAYTAGGQGLDGTVTSTPNSLSWGGDDADERSSVSITNVSSTDAGAPALITNAPLIDGGVFSHNNNAIDDRYRTLTGFNLGSTLSLAPDPQTNPALNETLGPLNFNSFFTETPNIAGSCVDGGAATACDDIFTLNNPGDLGGTQNNGGYTFTDSFDFDGYTYTVLLELGLTVLDDDLCDAAGAPNNCVGLVTLEDSNNEFQTRFGITAVEMVPEPGTLALLGLGLAGLGLTRRRKAAK